MKRRKFTAEFKRKVAWEAARGDETVRTISSRYGIHPNQVSKWKTEAYEGLLDVFAPGGVKPRDNGSEQLVERLYARIGQLTVERDFFSKGLESLGGRTR